MEVIFLTKKPKTKKTSSRVAIINAVKTPLGFFVLVVLVVEVALGGLAAKAEGENQLVALYGMLVVVLALIAVVAFFSYRRPEALIGERPPASDDTLKVATPSIEVNGALCAVTKTFEPLGADEDVSILEKSFPGKVTRLQPVTPETLKDILVKKKFEIIHLLGYVDPTSGEFHFENETISARGLLRLVEQAEAKLVFLATCDSLTLAAELARTVNVVAATNSVEINAMVQWEKMFYTLLSQGRKMSEAYEVALETSDSPMRLIMHRDMKFINKDVLA